MQSAPIRAQLFIEQNIETWAREEIIPEILANAGKFRDLYAQHLKIERVSPLKVNVVLDWQQKGHFIGEKKPIGIFVDQGTKAHIIEPRGPWPLHWIETVAAAKVFPQFSKAAGFIERHVYRWRVRHPGTKAVKAMEKGAKKGVPKFKKRVIMETTNFLERSKMT